MSKLVAFFLLITVSFSVVKSKTNNEETYKELMMYKEECMKEVGATQSDVDEVTFKKPNRSRAAKCFMACNMKKYGVMDNNGKYLKTAALEKIKMLCDGDEGAYKMAAEIIEICAEIPLPSDHCEAAETVTRCFEENAAHKSNTKTEK